MNWAVTRSLFDFYLPAIFLFAGATGQPLHPPPQPLQLLSLVVFLNDLKDCTAL